MKAACWDVPLTFCNLAKAYKHYYIFDFHFPAYKSYGNNSLLLLFDDL